MTAELERALDDAFRGPEWRGMRLGQILGALRARAGAAVDWIRPVARPTGGALSEARDFASEHLVLGSGLHIEDAGPEPEAGESADTGSPVSGSLSGSASFDPETVYQLSVAELLAVFRSTRGDAARRRLLAAAATAFAHDPPRAAELAQALPVPWQIQLNLFRHGLSVDAAASTSAPGPDVIDDIAAGVNQRSGNSAAAPFTGVGATGINATRLSVGVTSAPNVGTTGNAIRDLPGYSARLARGTIDAQAQVRMLTQQPVASLYPEAYAGNVPSRAEVIRLAAARHALAPELVAAVILAEQRDQSQQEDAAEFLGAIAPFGRHTSIGLGQVMTSNVGQARDLVNDAGRADRSTAAHLLSSDEVNIFATARILRETANRCVSLFERFHAERSPSAGQATFLPNTRREFPGFDPAAYARHSSQWPDDNIRALAMEYTSRAWDDRAGDGSFGAWGRFVWEAYEAVTAARVF